MIRLLLASALLSFFVAWIGSIWLGWKRYSLWQDQPGARSLHAAPVPRSGGLAIWAGVTAGAVLGSSIWQELIDVYLLLAILLLGVIAVWDDLRSISPWIRLLVQIVAALMAVVGAGISLADGLSQAGSVVSIVCLVVTVFVFLWGINLYNFMDGMDGFAGGMAVIGFGGLMILGGMAGDLAFAGLCSLIVLASVGFLIVNFPPAKLFMGDSGSTLLGFAMTGLSIMGWQREIYPFWVPLVLFSPFWVDASITIVKRLWRGEKIWQAHREHYYQRWVLAGFSHRLVVLAEYGLMVFCLIVVLAWQYGFAAHNNGLIFLWVLVCSGLVVMSERYLSSLAR